MSLHVSHNFNPGMTLFAFPVAIQDDWKQASINDKVASNRILMFAPLFYQNWIWVMLIQGKRKFLSEKP